MRFQHFPLDGPVAPLLEQFSTKENDRERFALAEALFARAPEDYAEKLSLEKVTTITESTFRFAKDFLKSKKAFAIESEQLSLNSTPTWTIRTALLDRPFIIDTLTELLDELSVKYRALLHPIFQAEKNGASEENISLVYLELSDSDIDIEIIRSALEQKFSNLIAITDDFPSMLETIRDIKVERSSEEIKKTAAENFIQWLCKTGFVFLGVRVWEKHSENLSLLGEEDLGVFRSENSLLQSQLANCQKDIEELAASESPLLFSKILRDSPVHRTSPMNLICFQASEKNKVRYIALVGLYTSQATKRDVTEIPIVKDKVAAVVKLEGLKRNTHDFKEFYSIANSIPLDDLLDLPTVRLRHEIKIIFGLQRRNKVRLSYYQRSSDSFVSVNVILPKRRFSEKARGKIQTFLEELLESEKGLSKHSLMFTDYPIVVIRFLLPNPNKKSIGEHKIEELEARIDQLTLTWDERVISSIKELGVEEEINRESQEQLKNLNEQYKRQTSPEVAAKDFLVLQTLHKDAPLRVSLSQAKDHASNFGLKIYRLGKQLSLSDIVPTLENAGFVVKSEHGSSVEAKSNSDRFVHSLFVENKSIEKTLTANQKKYFVRGLERTLEGVTENDSLNVLLLSPGLDIRQVALIRLYINYLWQIRAINSRGIFIEAFAQYPKIALHFTRLFEAKFSPSLSDAERGLDGAKERAAFLKALKKVQSLNHDRGFRALLNAAEATVRTNYFFSDSELRLSIKVACREIDEMPSPRPLFETFVNSPQFEGTHLRGGLVARGGLRWSDRKEDYRTEVLGLMKTQTVKNAVIVPAGAKGGFFIKETSEQSSPEQVEYIYRQFISSLLELADNRIDEKITRNEALVVYDKDDPYLVVAADKGTATFSDVANNVATNEFDFWLEDAFASGGSNGYDHKKFGITAKGAWESTKRHFRCLGVDMQENTFTVVGIGDMSGDVFGNGMLLSENIQLIAAFNHRHIFIDPTPDAKTSYAERKRMFELPRSTWLEYSSKLISKGGGVFERSSKEISLSPEAAKALNCDHETLSGEKLIQNILKAEVDLLWNGGIGTYIKAQNETDLQVGDRANNGVRINARDLRTRVIVEGGNLGLTQLARIEYSRIGGYVNTDAVDNSGGVDLSDLEVNCKILLSKVGKSLSEKKRNALLEELADECVQKILSRNHGQALLLSLEVRESRKQLEQYKDFINHLEETTTLDRELEKLPDNEELDKRSAMKAGLTRPELAILLAYAKMSISEDLSRSELKPSGIYLNSLCSYFPKKLEQEFPEQIKEHPLAREIICTRLANLIVETVGITFVQELQKETLGNTKSIVDAFLLAYELLDAKNLQEKLAELDTIKTSSIFAKCQLRTQHCLRDVTSWILEQRRSNSKNSEIDREAFKEKFATLLSKTAETLDDCERIRYEQKIAAFKGDGLSWELATTLASTTYVNSYLDITFISLEKKTDAVALAALFNNIADVLKLRDILDHASDFEPQSKWDKVAIRSLEQTTQKTVATLSRKILSNGSNLEPSISTFVKAVRSYATRNRPELNRHIQTVKEYRSEPFSITALLAVNTSLASLIHSK